MSMLILSRLAWGVFSKWEGAKQCLQEAEGNLIPRLWNELPETMVDVFGDVEINYDRCVDEGVISVSKMDSVVDCWIATSLDADGMEQLGVCTNLDYLYVTAEMKEFELSDIEK